MEHYETILGRLIGFDTTSHKSNLDCITYIRDYLDRYGVKSKLIGNDGGDKACLWATIGQSDKQGIVLSGHSDVVPVEGQNWASDPFKLTLKDDVFYGRGTCDMKGFIACVLSLVPELVKRKLERPIHLAFTYDEETDMAGALRLKDFLRAENIKPYWVLIGEPTELRLINAHKGVAGIATEITGLACHSSDPRKGLSANELGAQFIGLIYEEAAKRANNPFAPSRFNPAYTTLNASIVKGGTATNIIAATFDLDWEIRCHPGDNVAAVLKGIEAAADKKLAHRFRAFPCCGMKTHVRYDIPPLMPVADNPGERALSPLLASPEAGTMPFGTEAGIFQTIGAPTVICGPGSIDQAHKPDEFVTREQLKSCAGILAGLFMTAA